VDSEGSGPLDRHGIVNTGLEIISLGQTLADTGRLAAHARPDQLPAEYVAIADAADGIAEVLADLARKLRDDARTLVAAGPGDSSA